MPHRPLAPGDLVTDDLGQTHTVLTVDNWLIMTTGLTFRQADLGAANSDRRLVLEQPNPTGEPHAEHH